MNRTRVLLADDHTLILSGISRLLGDKVELVGTVRDGRSLVKTVDLVLPNVVILDISMPLLNGIDAARQIKKAHPDIKIIFLTMHADPDYVTEALAAGGSGYLLKWSAEEELAAAIDTVMRGDVYLTSELSRQLVEALGDKTIASSKMAHGLTEREREVLQLIVEGRAAKEIADILHLSVKTVEFHKYRIMKRLGVKSTVELARYALERQLLGFVIPPRDREVPQ